MKRIFRALVFSSGVMLLVAVPSLALPKTIYVDLANRSGVEDGSPTHPFSTVTKGYGAAIAGDTLMIRAGRYPERVTLNKAIIVKSEGGTASIQGLPPSVVDWPTPAQLSYAFCAAGTCTTHPIFEAGITWDQHIVQARALPTPKVRFGPFHVSATFAPANPAHLKGNFEISVWARSRALYNPDGKFAGANDQMQMIGKASASLTEESEQDLFVTVTLPSVFDALQIRAKVHDKASVFPAGCGDLPPEGNFSQEQLDALDAPCMKAAVNPLAAAVPHVAPLAIIYEPPGNCSFASLTDTDVVGSQIRVQDSNSTSVHSLSDPGPLASAFGAQKHDFTENKVSQTTRTSRVKVSQSSTYGTLLAFGPNPRCTDPQAMGPPRDHRGPGQGDVILLLVNPPILYWDTGTLSNFLFAPDSLKLPPGHEAHLIPAYAWMLAAPPDSQGNVTVAGVTFSAEEAKAILDLDPFTKAIPPIGAQGTGPFSYPELPKRFVPMSQIQPTPPRQGHIGQKITRESVVEADTQACTESSSANVDNNDPDFMTKLTVKALTYDLAFLVGKTVEGNKTFEELTKGISDAIKGVSLSDILPHAETKTTETYASCKNLQQTTGEERTQEFTLMDTDQYLDVLEYYDSFFGTVAFVPVPTGMGMIRDPKLLALRLPHFIWKSNVRNNQSINIGIPQEISTKLAAFGSSRLEAVASGDMGVPEGYTRGILPGLSLSQDGSKLSGLVSATQKGAAKALFIAKTSQGKPVALLWITTAITP